MISDNVKRKSWTRNKKQEKKRKEKKRKEKKRKEKKKLSCRQIWSGVSYHWVLTSHFSYICTSVSGTSSHSDGFHWSSLGSFPRSPRWGGHVTRRHSCPNPHASLSGCHLLHQWSTWTDVVLFSPACRLILQTDRPLTSAPSAGYQSFADVHSGGQIWRTRSEPFSIRHEHEQKLVD